MEVVLTEAARQDLADAFAWYDERIRETADRFLNEFDALVDRLENNPWQFPIADGDVRRAGFRRFPYGVFFCIREQRIEVLACFHASRKPRRWN